MSERQPLSLAARREALQRQCAEQRDVLALQVRSVRSPLGSAHDGKPQGLAAGLLSRVLGSPLPVKLGVAIAAVAGVAVARRRHAKAAPQHSIPTPLLTRALALWNTVQPLLAHLRR